MTHVQQGVYTRNEFHVCFIVHEVRICFDGSGYFFEFISVFQFDVYHAAVDSRAGRNGHGKSSFHSVNRFYGYCVSHAHTGTEVGVGDAFRSNCFQHGAYDGIASRIPSGRDDRYGFMFFGGSIQGTAQVYDTGVDIETVYRVNTHRQIFFCIFFYAAGRRAKNSYVYFSQLFYVLHYCVVC